MPVNDRYPLRDVLAACLRWREQRGKRVFIEYLMLAGVNDAPDQADGRWPSSCAHARPSRST